MNIVVDQLKQKPHNIPQNEGGDQVPVDDVSKTPYAPKPQRKVWWSGLYAHSIHSKERFYMLLQPHLCCI